LETAQRQTVLPDGIEIPTIRRSSRPKHGPAQKGMHDTYVRRRRYKRILGSTLVILVITAAILFIAMKYFVPTKMVFYRVVAGPKALQISGPGLLDATNRVIVSSRLEGRLATQPLNINQPVIKDQVLARIEAQEIIDQLAAARADAAAAVQRVAEARSDKEIEASVFDKASHDLERRKSLAGMGIASRLEFETADAVFRQAEVKLDRAKITIDRFAAQAMSADANVKVLEAKLAQATITSPLNGIVIERDKNLGELVQPGQPILQLVELQSIVVAARLDESLMDRLEKGQRVTVRFQSEPSQTYEGSVLQLHRILDQQTREFTVDISLGSLPSNWALGQRATVYFSSENPDRASVLVPLQFLSRQDGRPGFWFYRDGRARWGNVSLGYSTLELADIVSGVKPGDIVLDPSVCYEYALVKPLEQ
jgi:HlyD family secretion protein